MPLDVLAVGFCRKWRHGGGSVLKRVKERRAEYSAQHPHFCRVGTVSVTRLTGDRC